MLYNVKKGEIWEFTFLYPSLLSILALPRTFMAIKDTNRLMSLHGKQLITLILFFQVHFVFIEGLCVILK